MLRICFKLASLIAVAGLMAAPVFAQDSIAKSASAKKQAMPKAHATASTPAPQLTGESRGLHTLNRFTFGPRPGDVDKVQAMGVDQWFEQQLNPAAIADPVTDKRLAQYRTLSMPPAQIVIEFPDGNAIRRVSEGKQAYPQDPMMAGMYQVLVARQQKQDAKNQADQALPAGQIPREMTDAEKHAQKKQDRDAAIRLFYPIIERPKDQRMLAIMHSSVEDRIVLTANGNLPDDLKKQLVNEFNPREKELWYEMGNSGSGVAASELMQAKLVRSILSERQLQEVMTDFWFNHFNVFINKDADQYYTANYEASAIRPHALGKFRDLLMATAHHPAMLYYLDNWSSIGPDSPAAGGTKPGQKKNGKGLNENYGREVMELHTVGVNGGYSQADVTNLSKILTGWTIDNPQAGAGFVFDPKRHEPGTKQWFGQTVPEQGYEEGQHALEYLASRPQTAHFISYKIAQRFVADDPSPVLVDRMAKIFISSDGDIKEVLRTMFHSPEFWSTKTYRNKMKTPTEFITSVFRATATDPSNPQALAGTLQRMGMPLYQMLTPNGYGITADHWMNSSALVDRLNFSLSLTNGKVGGIKFDSQHVLALGLLAHTRPASTSMTQGTAQTVAITQTTMQPQTGLDEALNLIEGALVGDVVSAKTNNVIREQVAAQQPTQNNDPASQLNAITALVLGSPKFQMR